MSSVQRTAPNATPKLPQPDTARGPLAGVRRPRSEHALSGCRRATPSRVASCTRTLAIPRVPPRRSPRCSELRGKAAGADVGDLVAVGFEDDASVSLAAIARNEL